MTAAFKNPAVEAFAARAREPLKVAQVLVRPVGEGWELRHVEDAEAVAVSLQLRAVADLRAVAQTTEQGAFRPLRAAPNLQRGWRCEVRDAGALELAFHHLYPGALADWHAVETGSATPAHYREFTARQTGMYRITTMLDDAQAANVIQACCGAEFCLKRRRWTVEGLAPDTATAKSLIPCLEPCAVLLEFARKAVRIEQETGQGMTLTPSELETLREVLEIARDAADGSRREADFADALNPRRVALLLRKLGPVLEAAAQASGTPGDK